VSLFLSGRALFITLLVSAGYGQTSAEVNVFNREIRGHVHGAMTVELIDSNTQNFAGRSQVDQNGFFILRDVAPGKYIVRIIPDSGRGLSRAEEMQVCVGETELTQAQGPAGKVSVATLTAPPSKKTLKILKKAQEYSEGGDSAKAIETLKSISADDPSASYVHSRLGTEYLKTGQFSAAAPELEEAVRLSPKEPAHHSNLAYAYQSLGKNDMAEMEARKAIELDHTNAKAHFLLGSVLLNRQETVKEAMDNLKQARNEVPSARFLLAQAYLFAGQTDAARSEMDAFLEVANEGQKAAARRWLELHRAH
jgi:Tfp pilus assembly protein PilF